MGRQRNHSQFMHTNVHHHHHHCAPLARSPITLGFFPAARTLEAEARDIEREEQADSADAAARPAERVHEVGVGEHLLRHVGEVDGVGHDARARGPLVRKVVELKVNYKKK